jgi:hydrogenase-4 component B
LPGLVALGFAGGMLHVLNHAFFKCQLFYAAGCVYQAKHGVDMERLGGLAKLMPLTALSFLIGGIAISALPPFNGFASEFLIYSGLFSNDALSVWAKLALAAVATLLAFVGAVSALSITRAFGVIFMGQSRDDTLPAGHEANAWMLTPLLIHTAGTVLLGLIPLLGFALVAAPTELFLHALPQALRQSAMDNLHAVLGRVGLISMGVTAFIILFWLVSRLLRRQTVATGPTWGCGYTAPNARMQYSGSSFSREFAANYKGVILMLRRQKAPQGYFPDDAYVVSNCVDAVERRLYNVIGQGDESAGLISKNMREDDPRLGFALGLAAVVSIAALVMLAEGALP